MAAIQTDAATPVSPPVDNTPPVLSGGAPTGAQPAGTTQVNLQVTTSENATCRTGTVAGTAYGALPLTFTTTGGTAHARTITGLTNGTSYTYYVRCQDGAGNPTTADYPVSFSVSTPDSVPPTVSVTAPAGGSTVSATVPVNANANDNVGVVGVQFLLDGAALGSEDTSAPYSVSWNTTTATNGSHALTARARDLAGNQTTSTTVNVTVSNTRPRPLARSWPTASTAPAAPPGRQLGQQPQRHGDRGHLERPAATATPWPSTATTPGCARTPTWP